MLRRKRAHTPFVPRKKRREQKKPTVATVKRMIGRSEETKNPAPILNGGVTVVTTGAPTMALLFGGLQQGATDTLRNGQRIKIVKASMRAFVQNDVKQSSVIRIMIIRDKQTNGALPASTVDWFMDKNTANSWFSGYDYNFVGPRYQILKDKSYALTITGGATDQGVLKIFRWRLKKPKKVVYAISNFGDQRDIVTGSILLAVYTNAPTNGPGYAFEAQYHFKDA